MQKKLLHLPHEPIPAEIEARLTKPLERPLHQITVRLPNKTYIPVGPRLERRDVVEDILAAVKRMIAAGKERTWSDPHIVTLKN